MRFYGEDRAFDNEADSPRESQPRINFIAMWQDYRKQANQINLQINIKHETIQQSKPRIIARLFESKSNRVERLSQRAEHLQSIGDKLQQIISIAEGIKAKAMEYPVSYPSQADKLISKLNLEIERYGNDEKINKIHISKNNNKIDILNRQLGSKAEEPPKKIAKTDKQQSFSNSRHPSSPSDSDSWTPDSTPASSPRSDVSSAAYSAIVSIRPIEDADYNGRTAVAMNNKTEAMHGSKEELSHSGANISPSQSNAGGNNINYSKLPNMADKNLPKPPPREELQSIIATDEKTEAMHGSKPNAHVQNSSRPPWNGRSKLAPQPGQQEVFNSAPIISTGQGHSPPPQWGAQGKLLSSAPPCPAGQGYSKLPPQRGQRQPSDSAPGAQQGKATHGYPLRENRGNHSIALLRVLHDEASHLYLLML